MKYSKSGSITVLQPTCWAQRSHWINLVCCLFTIWVRLSTWRKVTRLRLYPVMTVDIQRDPTGLISFIVKFKFFIELVTPQISFKRHWGDQSSTLTLHCLNQYRSLKNVSLLSLLPKNQNYFETNASSNLSSFLLCFQELVEIHINDHLNWSKCGRESSKVQEWKGQSPNRVLAPVQLVTWHKPLTNEQIWHPLESLSHNAAPQDIHSCWKQMNDFDFIAPKQTVFQPGGNIDSRDLNMRCIKYIRHKHMAWLKPTT